jgi:hypothetical protein
MQSGSGAVDLATPHSGRLIVMDFVRHGMHGAQPRFAVMDDNLPRGRRGGILYSAAELIKKHPDQLLSHPDACLIAAAPDLLAALERVLSHERDIVYLFNRLGEGSPANFSLDCEKARAAIAKAQL